MLIITRFSRNALFQIFSLFFPVPSSFFSLFRLFDDVSGEFLYLFHK